MKKKNESPTSIVGGFRPNRHIFSSACQSGREEFKKRSLEHGVDELEKKNTRIIIET